MAANDKNQISISFIGDLAHTPPDDVLLVESDREYVRACRELSRHQRSNKALSVWVRSRIHFAWLRDFAKQIDCPTLFEEKTPRLVLAEAWNVMLPDWLTDAEVLDHGLLEIKVDSQKRLRFEARLLSHFLGPVFQLQALGSPDLVPIIKALVGEDAQASLRQQPLLRRCLEAICKQWVAASGEAWAKDICNRLPHEAAQVWHWLSLWSVLNRYPSKLLEYVLSPNQIVFVRRIPPDTVGDLPLEPRARDQVLTQIRLLFDEIQEQVTSSAEFQRIVGWTSGRLSLEYQLVTSILRNQRFAPTLADIQAVRERFVSCPGISASQLNALIYHVQPKRPTLLAPKEEWSLSEWVRWTTEEYVPYRIWQVHNDHFDPELEKTVARFSDWYIGEYTSIHQEPDLSVTHCLHNVSSLSSEKDLTIILLVDCLPLAFFEILNIALRNIDLSRHQLNCRFAGLPTITEYNKAALLSGQWQDEAGSYEAQLNARSESEWNGRKVIYVSTLKAMSEISAPSEAAIVVFNFLDGDEVLHSDVESQNTTYEDELHRLFARVADAVSRLSQDWSEPPERFGVYVVTDHGACRVLEEEKRSFDSSVVRKLFANEKHRFAAIPESQANEIPENLWAIGYRFRRPFSSEDTTFFLPRGHNTVRQVGIAKGYLHGGATPEEVIVPAAYYRMVKVAWKTPSARFLNLDLARDTNRAKFYVQRVVTLEIEIQNPNPVAIAILRATVLSPETDLKSFEAVTVPAGRSQLLKMGCYFLKGAVGDKPLELEVAYEIAGEQHTLSLTLESEFRSAMSRGFSLRDL